MSGQLLYFGLTHRTAGPDLRGRFLCDASSRAIMLEQLRRRMAERIVLSTCGRFEIYAAVATGDELAADPPETGCRWLADWFGVGVEELSPHVRMLRGGVVAEHLLRVAAGLESRILGEPQILTQVRRAYLEAAEAGAVGPVLSALGRAAIHTGRRVRRETPINQTAQSSATLAVDHLAARLGTFEGKTVAVLGCGHLAGDVLSAMAGRGRATVMVVARNEESAGNLARRVHGIGFGLSELARVLSSADALIACASSPTPLVEANTFTLRRDRRLCIVDLAVPRNVEPAVASLPRVELAHLDELLGFERPAALTDTGGGSVSPGRNGSAVAKAVEIVHEELKRFLAWHRERSVLPAILQLVNETHAAPQVDLQAAKRRLHASIMAVKAAVAA